MARKKKRRGTGGQRRGDRKVPAYHLVGEDDDSGATDEVAAATAEAPGPDATTAPDVSDLDSQAWGPLESERRALRAAALVASTVLAVYIFRLAPSPYLLDSTELVATTAALGISHPPGHPSFHLLASGALAFPIGTAAYRVHLAVATFSALTLAALPLCAALLGWLRTRTHLWFASIIAVALAFTPAFAQQSIRAEVYSLNALCLALATTVLCYGRNRGRPLGTTLLAAVALGVGLLNHHYLILLAFPAMLVAVVQRGRGSVARHVMGGSAVGLLLLGGYLYLPMRAAARPAIGWGWPESLSEIYWTVSAAAFQKTAEGAANVDLAAGLGNVWLLFSESLTPGVCAAGLAGLALLFRSDRGAAVVLALAIAGNILSQTLFEFDPKNPDVLGYFMPSFWWISLCLIFLAREIELPGSLAPVTKPIKLVFGVFVLGGVALSAAGSTWSTDLGDYWDSEYLRDEAYTGLRPESVWITAHYETGFNAWYASAVEDRRPDVLHLHQTFVTYPFYAEMVEALGSDAGALLGSEGSLLSISGLTERARRADVRVEALADLAETDGAPSSASGVIPPELARLTLPAGLYLHVLPEEPPPGEFPRQLAMESAQALERVRSRFPPLDASEPEVYEVQTARNLLFAHLNQGLQMCAAGRALTCRSLIHEARRLSPDDPVLAALAARLESESTAR